MRYFLVEIDSNYCGCNETLLLAVDAKTAQNTLLSAIDEYVYSLTIEWGELDEEDEEYQTSYELIPIAEESLPMYFEAGYSITQLT